MKKSIKIISLILCFCMVCPLLFGCVPGNHSNNTVELQQPTETYWPEIPDGAADDSALWANTEQPNIDITVVGAGKDLTEKEEQLTGEADKKVSLYDMVYSAVEADLQSVGFTTSFGFAFTEENQEQSVPGIYYSFDDFDAFSDESLDTCGFVEVVRDNDTPMSAFNDEDVIFVVDPALAEEKSFVYGFDYEGIGPYHFIYQNTYIVYNSESDGVVRYYEKENIRKNYDLSLGSLYNYDTDTYIYDESINEEYKTHSGESLLGSENYKQLEAELQKQVEAQNRAGYNVEEYRIVYISPEALQAYIDSEEEATFFGYNVSDLTAAFGLGTALVYTENGFRVSQIIEPTEEGYNWKSFLIKCGIGCGIILVGAILTPLTGGTSFGCALLTISKVAIGFAVKSAIGTLAIETVAGLIRGEGITNAVKNACYKSLDSFANGFMIGAAIGSVGVVSGAIKPGACFVAGTGVLLPNGTHKNIEDISIGDRVVSYDEESGAYTCQRVTDTFIKKADTLVEISVGGEKIVATVNHPFYVPACHSWIPAGKLSPGQKLLTAGNRYAEVSSVKFKECPNGVDVYNFTVENTHTYFVGEDPALVHNSCQDLSDTEVNNARAKAGRTAKKRALDELDGLRDPLTGKVKPNDLNSWASDWGLDMLDPNDSKVARFVAEHGRFPSYAAGDGFQCDFAHAVDVNKMVKAFQNGTISKEQAVEFMSNPSNGILTSRASHFYFLHGGNWTGTTNVQTALKARSVIQPVVDMILQALGAAA